MQPDWSHEIARDLATFPHTECERTDDDGQKNQVEYSNEKNDESETNIFKPNKSLMEQEGTSVGKLSMGELDFRVVGTHCS